VGSTVVLYDGAPLPERKAILWDMAQAERITVFGTSARWLAASEKAGLRPSETHELGSLRAILSTGSPLAPHSFDYVYQSVHPDVRLSSISGGTDIISCFALGNPTGSVWKGEIQMRGLGMRAEVWNNAGRPVVGIPGELVCTAPFPSMPVNFWGDTDGSRYRAAYFDRYPGVWRHGDWIQITEHKGIIIYGRSDATLNRGGIRIGTSEIYRAIDTVKEIKDSLIICLELDGGKFWMPLFVVMQDGIVLTQQIKDNIAETIRSAYSPRHVPDEIIGVPDIPYTISGKKTETPVKKVLMGKDPASVLNIGAIKNPTSMDFFIALVKERRQ
jgi:acetoacetyl-CoA synthetase